LPWTPVGSHSLGLGDLRHNCGGKPGCFREPLSATRPANNPASWFGGFLLFSPLSLFAVDIGVSAFLLNPQIYQEVYHGMPLFHRGYVSFLSPFVSAFISLSLRLLCLSHSLCLWLLSSWCLCDRLSFLPFLQLSSFHCLFLSLTQVLALPSCPLPAALLPACILAFPPPFLTAMMLRGEKGTIYLSETGSANLDHLSPAVGNYLEVGTGPGNCGLHRPAAQGPLLHASPRGGSLGAVPRM
jgi:hypothetical protein